MAKLKFGYIGVALGVLFFLLTWDHRADLLETGMTAKAESINLARACE